MLNISLQQVSQRWDRLPQSLREALYSDYNADILWQICRLRHLSEDKIQRVALLTGDVIYGFLQPEDLAQEIKTDLGLNPEIAEEISREIDRKIFSFIKADLRKAYQPPTPITAETEKPVPIEKGEIGSNARSAKEESAPTAVEPMFSAPTPFKPAPSPIPTPKTEKMEPEKEFQPRQPQTLEIKEIKPEIKPQESVAPEPAKPMEITGLPKSPSTVPFPEPEKPFILHEENAPRPADKKPGLFSATFGWFAKEKTPKIPEAVKVELETFRSRAQVQQPQPPLTAKTKPPQQKIVHYREAETPAPFGKTPEPTPPAFSTPRTEAEKKFQPTEWRPKPFGVVDAEKNKLEKSITPGKNILAEPIKPRQFASPFKSAEPAAPPAALRPITRPAEPTPKNSAVPPNLPIPTAPKTPPTADTTGRNTLKPSVSQNTQAWKINNRQP